MGSTPRLRVERIDYWVVYERDGHFTQTQSDQTLPGDVIQPTIPQLQVMDEIIAALEHKYQETSEPALKHAIRRLYPALICHIVGSVPFKLPVLSFCAVLGRKVSGNGKG